MNSSVEEVTLQLSVKPQKLWWWQIQQQVRQGEEDWLAGSLGRAPVAAVVQGYACNDSL
jgi:hypothetical protein